MFDSLLKNISLGVVRHLVGGLGAVLITDGYITKADSDSLMGSAMFVAALGWSIYEKWKAKKAQ